jgi:hypothetical protein
MLDEEPIKPSHSSKYNQSRVDISSSTPGDRHGHSGQALRNTTSNIVSSNGLMGGSDTNLFMEPQSSVKNKASQSQSKTISGKDPFHSFVADFDANNLHLGTAATGKTSELEAEVSNLKEQLKKTTLEKAEMTAKYEKLSAICRSQRQEIQELKRTVAETTPPPSSKVSSRIPEFGSQVLTLNLYLVQHICLSVNISSILRETYNPCSERRRSKGRCGSLSKGCLQATRRYPAPRQRHGRHFQRQRLRPGQRSTMQPMGGKT